MVGERTATHEKLPISARDDSDEVTRQMFESITWAGLRIVGHFLCDPVV